MEGEVRLQIGTSGRSQIFSGFYQQADTALLTALVEVNCCARRILTYIYSFSRKINKYPRNVPSTCTFPFAKACSELLGVRRCHSDLPCFGTAQRNKPMVLLSKGLYIYYIYSRRRTFCEVFFSPYKIIGGFFCHDLGVEVMR